MLRPFASLSSIISFWRLLTRGTRRFNLCMGLLGLAVGAGATLSTAVSGLVADRFGNAPALLALAAAGFAGVLGLLALQETRESRSGRSIAGAFGADAR